MGEDNKVSYVLIKKTHVFNFFPVGYKEERYFDSIKVFGIYDNKKEAIDKFRQVIDENQELVTGRYFYDTITHSPWIENTVFKYEDEKHCSGRPLTLMRESFSYYETLSDGAHVPRVYSIELHEVNNSVD